MARSSHSSNPRTRWSTRAPRPSRLPDAAPLHHRLDGDERAPVLVLLGSLGTTLDVWEPQLVGFARRFRVLRLDLPGHGRSPLPPSPLGIDDLARSGLAVLDDLGLRRVSFCGLSLGGAVGLRLSTLAPERVERLVLCCTAAKFGTPQRWIDRAEIVRREGLETIADRIMRLWFTPAADPSTVARHRAMLVSTPPDGYARCCDVLRDLDLRDAVSAVRVPTLVVAGAEDPAVAPEETELLRRIPGSRFVSIAHAAHLASAERPQAFERAVLSFASG
jgi:3-oxoadipate enol-lactonase